MLSENRARMLILSAFLPVVFIFPPVAAGSCFEDDFSSNTLSDWEVVDVGKHAAPSNWFISNGELHQTSNIFTTPFNGDPKADWTGTFLVSKRIRIKDGVIETTFRSTDDDGIGLVWRYRDRRNYYKVQLDQSGKFWQISKTVAGAFTCLAAGRDRYYIKGRRHRLAIHVQGPTAAVYFDGNLLGAIEDDSIAEGRTGFESRGNAGSHFEYLRVSTAPNPIDRAEIERSLARRALASLSLDRLACLPGEKLMLRLSPDARRRLPHFRIQVRSPAGTVLSKTSMDAVANGKAVWKNPGAPPGLYHVVLLDGGTVARELPFNVWKQVPPDIGVCAHRGDNRCAPENTIPAFRLAVEKGAHQIEFDVQSSRDGRLVVIHDPTLDRTTNGHGPVAKHTFEELRKLDAGSWKGPQWKGVRIPTFREVLEVVPPYITLNCHLRPGVAVKAARRIVEMGRIEQCFLACGKADARAAKKVDPCIRICNMENQSGPDSSYPDETIAMGAEYIQLMGWSECMPEVCAKLRAHGVTINYFGTSDPAMFRRLLQAGVQYPLTDNLDAMIAVLKEMGVPPAGPSRND